MCVCVCVCVCVKVNKEIKSDSMKKSWEKNAKFDEFIIKIDVERSH